MPCWDRGLFRQSDFVLVVFVFVVVLLAPVKVIGQYFFYAAPFLLLVFPDYIYTFHQLPMTPSDRNISLTLLIAIHSGTDWGIIRNDS